MATIKFGAIVTDMRGKLGGHVFQKGNQSRVMKSYAQPRGVNSVLKRVTQTFVNLSIAAYSGLSDSLKNQWETLAKNFSFKNRFGDDVTYTGRQFFLFLYTNLQKGGQSLSVTPSNFSSSLLAYSLSSVTFNVGGAVMTVVGDNALGSNRALYTVLVVNKRIQTVNINRFVFLGNAGSTNASFAGIYATFVARYGVPTTAMGIYVAVQTVNPSGYVNAPRWVRASVT